MRTADLHRIATARPLPIDQPAAALAYRLVDAFGDRTPATSTTQAAARSIAREDVPPVLTVRRPYEPPPLPSPAPQPDYERIFGSHPRLGHRR